MTTLAVRWARDGNIQWEDWWVRRHGYRRTRQPGEKEHISFANHDLLLNGLPRLREHEDGSMSIDVTPQNEPVVRHLLDDHGFVAHELDGNE